MQTLGAVPTWMPPIAKLPLGSDTRSKIRPTPRGTASRLHTRPSKRQRFSDPLSARTSQWLPDASCQAAKPVPPLSAVHTCPFHRATKYAGEPPAVAKLPLTTRSPLGAAASELTGPPTPRPSGDQTLPFQRARLFAATPRNDA